MPIFYCSTDKLSENEAQVARSRIMICGPGRAGKSSLIDSLRNKPISKKRDSTQGVSLSKVTCHITQEAGKSQWPEETDKETHEQLFLEESLSSALDSNSHGPASIEHGHPDGAQHNGTSQHNTPSQHGPNKEAQQSPTSPSFESATGATNHDQGTKEHSKHKALKACVQQLAASQKAQQNSHPTRPRGKRIHFLDIWDFGGQQAYAFLHHMLLSGRRCEYIVAFNGSIPMDSIAPPETFGLDGVEHAVVDLRGQQTYGGVVIRWLDVIYQSVDEKTRVRLVGTHLDKVRCWIRSKKCSPSRIQRRFLSNAFPDLLCLWSKRFTL